MNNVHIKQYQNNVVIIIIYMLNTHGTKLIYLFTYKPIKS